MKGFGVAIVRTLIMLAVAALGLSLTTVVLQLPYAVMDTWIFGLTIPMPTLLGGPLSESGLAQAAFCAIGWPLRARSYCDWAAAHCVNSRICAT